MRILVHNLSRTFFRYIPETFDFDQNAFFFADPGDIVVTRRPLLSERYMQFLRSIGAVRDGVVHLYPTKDTGTPTSIFRSVDHLPELTDAIDQAGTVIPDVFEVTTAEYEWFSRLGVTLPMLPATVAMLRRKSVFKDIARRTGVSVPAGYRCGSSRVRVLAGAYALCWRGARNIVTKIDEGARGIGSLVVPRDRLLSIGGVRSVFRDARVHKIEGQSADRIVEEWYEDVTCTPSIQFKVDADGSVGHISMHMQTMKSDHVTYAGCRSERYLAEVIRQQMMSEGMRLACAYRDRGFRGRISFDAIVRRTGDIVWVEANTHRTLTAYAFQLASRITGDGKSAVYESATLIVPRDCRNIDVLLDHCRDLLFDPATRHGVVPYNLCLQNTLGMVDILFVGESTQEVQSLRKELTKTLVTCEQ